MITSTALIDETLTQWREAVDDRLVEYVNVRAASAHSDCPPRLQAAMEYSLLAGGKRLRPLLVLMACDACGGDEATAMPAACAIEMIHTYSLIHDDLPAMDDDDLRRGRPTCHIEFDEATAILAGDALLTLAFEVLATDINPSATAAACCADLAGAAGWEGMVGGQMADVEGGLSRGDGEAGHVGNAAFNDPQSVLESIHRRKTGRLLCSALIMGGRIAGANPQTLRHLMTYGEKIGLAFQIADDLLDVCGDAETMGKQVHKDADGGKLTYPGLLGIPHSRSRAASLVEEACQAIETFGERGHRLAAVAQYIIDRDH